jgi:rubrerythrin
MNKSNFIQIQNDLGKSHFGENTKLNRIIDAYLKIQGKHKPFVDLEQNFFWDAEHFNLHKSTLFTQASEEKKQLILEKCSKDLICESYFVEKSAFAYCAKMMLLAETTEIAQVYSMIANEEAIHLEWITPYMDIKRRQKQPGEFFEFLSFLIEECDSNLLPYLVQIILEGWGLHHYKSLAQGCKNERLKSVFLSIVRDEALHHHTGEVIFNSKITTASQNIFIEDCLKTFTEMVRSGPLQLLAAVDEALGGLNQVDKSKFLLEIDALSSTSQKLNLLRKLMIQPGMEKTIHKLDEEGYFTPK